MSNYSRLLAVPLHVQKNYKGREKFPLFPSFPIASPVTTGQIHFPKERNNIHFSPTNDQPFPSIKMQISTYFYAAIAVFAAQATAQACLPNGNICVSTITKEKYQGPLLICGL